MFYWVLLCLTGFYWVLHGLEWGLLSLAWFYWVSLGLTGFYWVLLGFYWVWHGFTDIYWLLLGFTGFRMVLLSFTVFYWVVLCLTGFYWVSHSLEWVLLGFTGFCTRCGRSMTKRDGWTLSGRTSTCTSPYRGWSIFHRFYRVSYWVFPRRLSNGLDKELVLTLNWVLPKEVKKKAHRCFDRRLDLGGSADATNKKENKNKRESPYFPAIQRRRRPVQEEDDTNEDTKEERDVEEEEEEDVEKKWTNR